MTVDIITPSPSPFPQQYLVQIVPLRPQCLIHFQEHEISLQYLMLHMVVMVMVMGMGIVMLMAMAMVMVMGMGMAGW